MRKRTRTPQSSLSAALLVVAVGCVGCGGFTIQLGGGGSSRGYYYDDFYYDYGGHSYYDSYWYYDDYSYYYDDYYYVDYVDGWYYDGYGGCYYCKSSDDLDATLLEEPASWDAEWGPWERFVRARVDFMLAERGSWQLRATGSTR